MRIQTVVGFSLLHLLFAALAPAKAAVIVVDTLSDAIAEDGFCSVREAILAANENSAAGECPSGSGESDRIRFAVTGTILLSSALPAIDESVAFEGPGRDLLTIDGGDQFQLLWFGASSPTQYVVRDLSLVHGYASVPGILSFGGCVLAWGPGPALALFDVTIRNCRAVANGGGIYSQGPLRLQRVWVDGNEAQSIAGGGGGVAATGVGDVEIIDSTFSGNFASGTSGSGGGLYASAVGQTLVANSTFSSNRANWRGGANLLSGVGTGTLSVTIRDSTYLGNESDDDETSSDPTGGTIALANQVTSMLEVELANTVIAGGKDNASPTRCPEILIAEGDVRAVLTSGGFNLVADGACVETAFPASPGAGLPNLQGDFVGTLASPIDPRLDILAGNGGSTPTHLPLQETPHPVIDQGSCPASGQDQRGLRGAASSHRAHDVAAVPDNPEGDGCDIGAVERGASSPARTLFVDGFESATTLFWSADLP
ncbi:MAG: hypothetical protein KBI44_07980 [Thermoanaerobaculia bacterium]|nr:hypothetical protein [Thermoanaerobaculia bacterium]